MELTDLRYTLAMDRIREIPGEHLVPAEYEQYFEDGAKWFLQMEEEERFLLSEETQTEDLTLLQERNRRLYEEMRRSCRKITAEAGQIPNMPLKSWVRRPDRSSRRFAMRSEARSLLYTDFFGSAS